ncbi:MAG TPA: DeoR/GlpR family DNA-binding transcription regulator [Chloroflexota bacterium]|nr:DeoR/GlpR family DNA-binding transcription regulator [Chloroflexota bacterium]
MLQELRRELIAAEIGQNQAMSVEAVARRFGCSLATARRDLQALADAGRIRRARGGALALTNGSLSSALSGHNGSAGDAVEAVKRRIGRAAAGLVVDGETVGISGGTTTLEVARCLRGRHIGVVTNALDPALELAAIPGPRVVLVGGVLDFSWGRELVGPLAELLLGQLSMDILFISVNGISAESGITVLGEFEAQVLRAMSARARRVVVVADHTKVGRVALASVLPVEAIHTFVTDTCTAESDLGAISAAGVVVLRV